MSRMPQLLFAPNATENQATADTCMLTPAQYRALRFPKSRFPRAPSRALMCGSDSCFRAASEGSNGDLDEVGQMLSISKLGSGNETTWQGSTYPTSSDASNLVNPSDDASPKRQRSDVCCDMQSSLHRARSNVDELYYHDQGGSKSGQVPVEEGISKRHRGEDRCVQYSMHRARSNLDTLYYNDKVGTTGEPATRTRAATVESLQVETSGAYLHRARSNIDELYYHEHRANPHPEASPDGAAVYQLAKSSEFGRAEGHQPMAT